MWRLLGGAETPKGKPPNLPVAGGNQEGHLSQRLPLEQRGTPAPHRAPQSI